MSFSHSVVSDSATSRTVACQAPLSVEFSRQEYWSGLPFPSPKDFPNSGVEPISPAWQVDSLSHLGSPRGQLFLPSRQGARCSRHAVTLVWEGPPASMGAQVSVIATALPAWGGGPRTQAQATSRGCESRLCRDERRGAPGSWGGCDELVWTIRGLPGRRGPWAEEQGSW